MSVALKQNQHPRRLAATLMGLCVFVARVSPALAQDTIDVGETGFDVKRPVLASACPNGCPWGELGDFVKEAMEPFGYEVILCRNCNRALGPPLVANAGYPPEITALDTYVGTTTRVNAPVDFGITNSSRLTWAYAGVHGYAQDVAYANLRLIAKIEDPSYLLVAVKADSGITDLSQIAEQRLPVVIAGGGSPISQPILDYYGLTQEAVTSWGGTFQDATILGQATDPGFDVVITENASPANNPESSYWTKFSQAHDLRFLDLPEAVLDQLANDQTLGVKRVVVKWGLLRGVDRPIPTVARTGHVVFARDDTPEQAAYEVAKAIDQHRGALKWYIRPYSYESRTVWENFGVPLHPGAQRYYREAGYLPGSEAASCKPGASDDGGCSVGGQPSQDSLLALVPALVLLLARRRRTAR
jgi:TRAP transporter TAXI family solute receptor